MRTAKNTNTCEWLAGNWTNDRNAIIAGLKKSGLSLDTCLNAGLERFSGTNDELKAILGFDTINGQKILDVATDILLIPYSKDVCRVRLYPSVGDTKYLSPKGSAPLPYIPSAAEAVADKRNKEIWIVEGEKKALKLEQEGEAAISVPGVYNFRLSSEKSAEKDFLNEKELLFDLQRFALPGRTVFLAFDADMWTNPDVRTALFSLAFTLLNRNCVVKIVTWNSAQGKGIDDFLAAGGDLLKIKEFATEISKFFTENKEFVTEAYRGLKRVNISGNDVLVSRLKTLFRKLGVDAKTFKTATAEQGKSRITAPTRDEQTNYVIPPPLRRVNNRLVSVRINSQTQEEEIYDICPFCAPSKVIRSADDAALELSFFDGKAVRIAMDCIGDVRKLAAELNQKRGMAITAKDAKTVAEYLSNFLKVNDNVPVIKLLEKTGWHRIDGKTRFLAPTTITGESAMFAQDIANKVVASGDAKKQNEFLNNVFTWHIGAAIISLAGLAVPLLKLLGLPNYVFFTGGLNGTGKTLANQVMLSLYGDPEKLKNTMNSTLVGNEILFSKFHDIPVYLDELETAGQDEAKIHSALVHLIYNFQAGAGRTRAQKSLALRETAQFRGVLFLSSERSIASILCNNTSQKANQGVYRRVLELSDSVPFFASNANYAQVAEEISLNHGHILPVWVNYLTANAVAIREEFLKLKESKNIPALGGKQDFLLSIYLAYRLAVKVLELPENNGIIDGINLMLKENAATFKSENTHIHERYEDSIREFALTCGKFIDREKADNDATYRPPVQLIGQYELDDDKPVYFFTLKALTLFCNEYRYEKDRVVKFFKDKGALAYKNKKINGQSVKVYQFSIIQEESDDEL